MSRENHTENEHEGQPDLASSLLQKFDVLTEELLTSIRLENPSRLSIVEAITNFRVTILNLMDQTQLDENLLTLKERGIATSFIQIKRIVDIMLSKQGLPPYVVKTFRERFDYYHYYSDTPREHLKMVGPNFFSSIIEYKFREMPFVDLWGTARNLNWGGFDYVPGSSMGHYKDFTTEAFMQMFAGLEEDLGAKVKPDYTIYPDSKIRRLRGTSAEDTMYDIGFFLLTFDHFPSIVASVVVSSDLEEYKYDFNNPESRKKFMETALGRKVGGFYITTFGLRDIGSNVSDLL